MCDKACNLSTLINSNIQTKPSTWISLANVILLYIVKLGLKLNDDDDDCKTRIIS